MFGSKRTAVGVVMTLVVAAGGRGAADQAKLADAVKARDRATVQTLLKQHADVNVPAADGSTALYYAAENNDLEIVKALIAAGADVNAANRYGVTPLALAAVNGSVPITEALLAASANPNAATPQGETVLMTAARTGVPEVISALIKRGANVNAKENSRGQTALMWAAGEGHAGAVRSLVAGGADLRARSKGGWTALLFAAREGQADAVQALLESGSALTEEQQPPAGGGRGRGNGGGNVGVGGGGGGGAAAGGGRAAAPAAGGPTALMLAIGSNHYELAAHLLELGADPNASAQGWTALHQITWMRKPGQGSNGPGPAGSGNMDSLALVRRLVANGADLNARMTRRAQAGTTALNMIGATPFLMAARTADAPLMRLLAELGADPWLTNEDGTTPLMVAAGLGVHSPGEDPGTEAEALEAVKVAVGLGGDVNAIDKNGDTAMHGVYLVDQGASVDVWNSKNKQGWTPLRIAVGVHRGMNFRFSKPTAEVIAKIMTAEGVSTVVEPEKVISGATK
jgi:uncharacterized protein